MIHETWSKGWRLRYWLAPLQVTWEETFQAGTLIEGLVESRPAPKAAAIDFEDCDKLSRELWGFIGRPRHAPAPSRGKSDTSTGNPRRLRRRLVIQGTIQL